MIFKKQHFIFFFLDDFHHGTFNHIMHFIGFTIGYGLGKPNIVTISLSPFIMESGHIYNFLKGRHKEHFIKIIPLQLLSWIIFILLGYFLARSLGY